MNIAPILVSFLVVFPAEIPDKTMISTILLSSKYKLLIVWLGAVCAFFLQVVLDVTLGSLITNLPHRYVEIGISAIFTGGAIYLLLTKEPDEKEAKELEEREESRHKKAFIIAFLVTFFGEFGDLTQILIINLAAKYQNPIGVGIGSFAGLISVVLLGGIFGKTLIKYVSLQVIRKIAGIILLGFAIYSIVGVIN